MDCHKLTCCSYCMSEDKVRTSSDTDNIVCAEIPDEDTEPEPFQTIQSSMIHGPCGVLNPKSVCIGDGTRTKGYPKQFSETTLDNVDGYPSYRRCDGQQLSLDRMKLIIGGLCHSTHCFQRSLMPI